MSSPWVEIEEWWCWCWGGGVNLDLISFLTVDNISTFVTEDRVALAAWLTGCHLPGLSLTSSPVATCPTPFDRQPRGTKWHSWPLRMSASKMTTRITDCTRVCISYGQPHARTHTHAHRICTQCAHTLTHTHTTEDHLISESVRGGNPIVWQPGYR